jgi:glycerate kinase
MSRVMKRLLIAPDKFKDSMTAATAAAAIADAAKSIDPDIQIDLCPLADGGEGTVQALVEATGGKYVTHPVTGPRSDMRVDATFGFLGNSTERIAVIEMSAASGLALLQPDERDPMQTTTFGTGELLLEAARRGASQIILGIGGSATVDGGIGCAQACGLPVILEGQGPADPRDPLVGDDLRRVVLVKHARGSPLDRVRIRVACDVTNPLFGPNGAARVYGPQKGATPEQVQELDRLLEQLARRCDKLAEAQIPGAGAAGGLGFAMLAFFNATLERGFDLVAEAVRLRGRIATADLIITGEGRLDRSSLAGKTPISLARRCHDMNKPCIGFFGSIERGTESAEPSMKCFPIAPPDLPLADALRRGPELLHRGARDALAAIVHRAQ